MLIPWLLHFVPVLNTLACTIGVRGGGSCRYPGLKTFRVNFVFRTRASCSKILNDKKYIFNAVNSGDTMFFRASASCSKILNVKSIFNTVKNFRASSVLHGKREVVQKSWMVKNIFNTVKIFRANSVFQGKRKLLKIQTVKKFSIQCIQGIFTWGWSV